MSTEFGSILQQVIENKSNDINSFTWRFQNGKDVKLIDCTREELKKFWKHSNEMLYNTNRYNPGKITIRENINRIYNDCNAELFVRYLLTECEVDALKTRKDILDYINQRKSADNLSLSDSIATIFTGLPAIYEKITLAKLMDACFDKLEIINKKMISDKFILAQGIWLTDAEKEELTEYDSNGKMRNRMDVIKERLIINPEIKLRICPTGLSYSEFRALRQMPNLPKIVDLPSVTLKTLRDKILLLLNNDLDYHIHKWETIKNNIQRVAEYKNWSLDIN